MSPIEAVLLCVAVIAALTVSYYCLSSWRTAANTQPRRLPFVEDSLNSRMREVESSAQIQRESSEPSGLWPPTAIENVDLSNEEAAYTAWFADTTAEPYQDNKSHGSAEAPTSMGGTLVALELPDRQSLSKTQTRQANDPSRSPPHAP